MPKSQLLYHSVEARGQIVLIGGGGHASDVLNVLTRANLHDEVLGYLDDLGPQHRMEKWGLNFLGPAKSTALIDARFVVAIGIPSTAAVITDSMQLLSCSPQRVIDPDSTIGHGVEIGDGAVVLAGARMSPFVIIGAQSYVSQNTSIGHDTTLGEYCSVMPGAILSGDCTIGARVLIGTGSTVLPGITVGDGATVGAGAVVTKSVDPGQTVVGIPAMPLHERALT